jgi:beta-phosphoglucomutase
MEVMSKELKGIIFDLDGVITDTAEFHYLAWKKLASELNITLSEDLNEKLKGISRLQSLEIILQSANLQDNFSDLEKIELADRKNDYYLNLIQTISPKNILPGIVPFINECKSFSCKIGLASASKNAKLVLEKLELTDKFDYIVDAGKISRGKPDPEIFLTAAHKLGLSTSQCIGIEDAASGIMAIKSANMFAVGIGSPKTLAGADVIIESTSQLSFQDLLTAFQTE